VLVKRLPYMLIGFRDIVDTQSTVPASAGVREVLSA
jgi:hypothetical protein